jgi:anti-sigma-K factor RskA
MNVDITTFLNSDLLENYLIGQTTPEETLKVEDYIKKYPEVKAAYNTMQNQLELVAQTNAEEAPLHLLGSILESIDDKPVVALNTAPSKKSWYKFGVAASVAAILFASASFYFFNLNQKLTNENQIVVDELFDLRNDIDKNNSKLEALMEQFAQLNNPETEKYIIKGNKRAKNLKTVAYINPKEKTSMIDVVALPTLPKEKCYQIWAEMQDRMVSLGILSETDRRLQKIPYTEDALGLTITIEPKGGSENISGDTPVAEIELKIND